MKISFDFDGTLSRPDVQKFALTLIKNGHDVHITTSRCDNTYSVYYSIKYDNDDLFEIAEKLGISKDKIFFTCGNYKWEYLLQNDYDCHFDDDDRELELLKGYDCIGLNVRKSYWKRSFIYNLK